MNKKINSFIILIAITLSVTQGAFAVSLDKKLQRQFSLYKKTQNLMLKMSDEDRYLSREEFENSLTPTGDFVINLDDINALNAKHDRIIQKNKQRAKEASVINLDLVRDPKRAGAFCAEFPKGGMLHVHPSGTMDRQTMHKIMTAADPVISYDKVQKLTSKKGAEFYPNDIAFLNAITQETNYIVLDPSIQNQIDNLFVLPEGKHPFTRFEGIFSLQAIYKKTANNIDYWSIVYNDFLARAVAQHVRYVEFTKTFTIDDKMIPEVEALVAKFKNDYGITVKFNFAFIRTLDKDKNAEVIKKFIALPKSKAFVGIDLYAEETNSPALENAQKIYIPLLRKNKDNETDLQMTMHAGEMGYVHNVRDALIMGSKRIGHGTRLIEDPIALEYARRQKTPIEINIVSNLKLGNIDSPKDHPFLKYMRLGLKPSLSTDDEGMFGTDMNRECVEAVSGTDIQYAELKQMAINSIKTSFASAEEKRELLSDLELDLEEFETNWAFKITH